MLHLWHPRSLPNGNLKFFKFEVLTLDTQAIHNKSFILSPHLKPVCTDPGHIKRGNNRKTLYSVSFSFEVTFSLR